MSDRKPTDDELARRLEAYAEARLSPDGAARVRIRALVLQMARTQGRPELEVEILAARLERRRSPWRRPAALLLAATLTLALGVGSVAAAQPGGPLYSVRIWTETLTLPSSAAERALAELRRLQDRLSEAAASTAAGDTNAANAALEAYESIVNEATEDAGNDVSAAATLETGVRSNIDVLTVLAGRDLPGRAQDAIRRAIERSGAALDTMNERPGGASPGDPAPQPNGTGKPDRTANPNKPSPEPAETTTKSPRPSRVPNGPPSDPTGNGAGSSQGNGGGNNGSNGQGN